MEISKSTSLEIILASVTTGFRNAVVNTYNQFAKMVVPKSWTRATGSIVLMDDM
jgi:hypothetical protein